VDVTAEDHPADRADERGGGERGPEIEEALAQGLEQQYLPDEVIAGARPAVGEEQLHARQRRLERAGRPPRDRHLRGEEQRDRGAEEHERGGAERGARSETL